MVTWAQGTGSPHPQVPCPAVLTLASLGALSIGGGLQGPESGLGCGVLGTEAAGPGLLLQRTLGTLGTCTCWPSTRDRGWRPGGGPHPGGGSLGREGGPGESGGAAVQVPASSPRWGPDRDPGGGVR